MEIVDLYIMQLIHEDYDGTSVEDIIKTDVPEHIMRDEFDKMKDKKGISIPYEIFNDLINEGYTIERLDVVEFTYDNFNR